MISIDYGSDVHDSHFMYIPDWKNIKNPDSDILIMAGDNDNTAYGAVYVINEAQKYYKNVLWVPGNHDTYETGETRLVTPENPYTVAERMDFWARTAKKEGWTFLPDTDFIIGDTVIIGEMGWYDFNHPNYSYELQKSTWNRYLADARYTNFDKNRGPEVLALEDAVKLSEKIKKYDMNDSINNIIVVTHSLPIKEALIIKPTNLVWNLLSGSFWNSHLEDLYLQSKKVKYHIFGHTHSCHHIIKEHATFLCNPRGYPTEECSEDWRPKTIIIS